MSTPSIQIATSKTALPQCSPNLMPFRINYTGRAALKTFFRVKPAASLEGKVESEEKGEVASEEADGTQSTDATRVEGDPGSQTDVTMDSQTTAVTAPTSTKVPAPSLGARFTAAFRGRTMKGVTVNLPEGYGGIVLRADDGGAKGGRGANGRMDKEKEKPKRGRRGRKAEVIDVDEDVDMEESANGVDGEDVEESTRTLKPTAQFSSFVLWNPDLPVDQSRDEYLRSLTEWTKLAAEVRVLIFGVLKVWAGG